MQPNEQLSELMGNLRDHYAAAAEDGSSEAVTSYDFHRALGVANGVMEQYKLDQPKWWKRMDGTPILNDLPVIMALAFQAECEALEKRAIEAEELNRNFMDSVNGPTHMGEPVIDKAPVITSAHLWGISGLADQLEAAGHRDRSQKWRDLGQALAAGAEFHADGSVILDTAQQQSEPTTPMEVLRAFYAPDMSPEEFARMWPEFKAPLKDEQRSEPGADEAAVAVPFLTTHVEGDPDPTKQRFRVVAEYRSLDDMHRGHDLFVAAVKAAQSGQRAGVPTYRCSNVHVKSLSDGNVMVTMLAKAFEPAAEYEVQPVNPAAVRAAPTQQQEGK